MLDFSRIGTLSYNTFSICDVAKYLKVLGSLAGQRLQSITVWQFSPMLDDMEALPNSETSCSLPAFMWRLSLGPKV